MNNEQWIIDNRIFFILPFYSFTPKFILLFYGPTRKFEGVCVVKFVKIRLFCFVMFFQCTNCNFLVGISRLVVSVFCNFALLLCFSNSRYEAYF